MKPIPSCISLREAKKRCSSLSRNGWIASRLGPERSDRTTQSRGSLRSRTSRLARSLPRSRLPCRVHNRSCTPGPGRRDSQPPCPSDRPLVRLVTKAAIGILVPRVAALSLSLRKALSVTGSVPRLVSGLYLRTVHGVGALTLRAWPAQSPHGHTWPSGGAAGSDEQREQAISWTGHPRLLGR